MVEYATLSELRAIREGMLFEERASVVRKAEERSPKGATFLSHSSKDVEYLHSVIKLLENHGASVYVDKKDDALPFFTSRERAAILRSRIAQSRKFVLFATSVSKDSRWMPWELGVSDGLKDPERTVVLSGLDTANDTTWAEREYIGVYDRIVYGRFEGTQGEVWMVWNQELNKGMGVVRLARGLICRIGLARDPIWTRRGRPRKDDRMVPAQIREGGAAAS